MSRPADPTAKDALVAAARAEFARKGLRGARVEDITHACGLSKGAFYLHYPSKEALFGELVEAFVAATREGTKDRRAALTGFLDRHGPINRKDQALKTARYRELLELEAAHDLRSLERLWAYRDVLGVLLRGAQGTSFEGFVWTLTDGEVDRVKDDFARFQGNACRADIPAEIVGSLVVGTYLLLALRMSRMKEKPDLAAWSRSMHTLIREGTAPTDEPPRSKQASGSHDFAIKNRSIVPKPPSAAGTSRKDKDEST
jgi:AcrR family transcriptional regulator